MGSYIQRRQELYDLKHELNEKSAEIDKQIRELDKEEMQLIQDNLSKLVGHAFARKSEPSTVFFVYDIPKERFDIMGHVDFNPYQIPVLMFTMDTTKWNEKDSPQLSRETVHSRDAFKVEDALEYFRKEYTEITLEDFWETVNTKVRQFTREVINGKNNSD